MLKLYQFFLISIKCYMKVFCVDLDGTLIKTDMLFENFLAKFKQNPFIVFLCLFWLVVGGKLKLKTELAKNYKYEIHSIPINKNVLELIKKKKEQNYKIVLISASHTTIVKQFFDYYNKKEKNLFDDFFGTETCNLSATNKRVKIQQIYPNAKIEYIGNSKDDLPIWDICNQIYYIGKNLKLINNIKKLNATYTILEPEYKNFIPTTIKQLRIHQWSKNALIFVPTLAIHKILPFDDYLLLFISFLSFSFMCSAVYIINDLFDLDNDRKHLTKKNRPIACGDFSISKSLIFVPILLLMGMTLACLVAKRFVAFELLYLIINIVYSIKLKKVAILDCIVLALMYTFRIFIGCVAVGIPISLWMISFALFLFLALSTIKRYIEIKKYASDTNKIIKGRGYTYDDLPIIGQISITSGFMSVLVFALYLNSDEIKSSFSSIWFNYGCIPILLYWLMFIFIKAHRKEISDDPVAFSLTNITSLFLGFLFALLFILGVVI